MPKALFFRKWPWMSTFLDSVPCAQGAAFLLLQMIELRQSKHVCCESKSDGRVSERSQWMKGHIAFFAECFVLLHTSRSSRVLKVNLKN